jgi:cytolysin-activating lysine-acyltransferase
LFAVSVYFKKGGAPVMLFGKKKDKTGKEAAPAASPSPAGAKGPASVGNGSPAKAGAAGASASALSAEELRRRQVMSRRISLAFGEIVSVLMRSKTHRQWNLAAVEQLVVPAVLTGQFTLAQARSQANGMTAPVAVVLWASVSAEIDKRLAAESDQPVRLEPKDWKSGDKVWLVEAVGDARVVNALL